MDTSHIEILQSSLLFRGMSREEIEEVAEKIPSRVKTFEKGDFIARDGEELSYMAIILKGRVHLFHIDPDGNNNLLEALGPGEAVGMLNAAGGYRLHISAVCLEETEAFCLKGSSLLNENSLDSSLELRLLRNLAVALAQKAHRLTVKLEDSIRRSTREKLQDYLSLQYHRAESRRFTIPLNRQELADFLFVDRSALSKELCRMRDEGLLKFEKSRFELLIEMPLTDEEKDPNEKL